MLSMCTIPILVAILSVTLAEKRVIDSDVTGKWQYNGCKKDGARCASRASSIDQPECEISYHDDNGEDIFRWTRKQDGGELSGYILHTSFHGGDAWSSYCEVDREAKSEHGRKIQAAIASDCDKVNGMYYTGEGKDNVEQHYSNGVVCTFTRI